VSEPLDSIPKEEQVLKDLLKAVQAYQSRTNEPATELSDDFRKGARAMFDSLLCRAANNYHGNPSVDAACTEENKIVTAWAADALAEVSVDDWNEWASITDLRRENDELKAQVRAAQPPGVARPASEWHEDMGDVLWWKFPIDSAPYCGSPLDSHWQEHELDKVFTHWTPLQLPADPTLTKEGE
jgi:hypothetical protein